jgi:hypothetical protein
MLPTGLTYAFLTTYEPFRTQIIFLCQPFKGVNPTTYVDSSANVLSLVDGGEQLENIPLFPLMVKSRQLDVVAVHASADTNYSWPE